MLQQSFVDVTHLLFLTYYTNNNLCSTLVSYSIFVCLFVVFVFVCSMVPDHLHLFSFFLPRFLFVLHKWTYCAFNIIRQIFHY